MAITGFSAEECSQASQLMAEFAASCLANPDSESQQREMLVGNLVLISALETGTMKISELAQAVAVHLVEAGADRLQADMIVAENVWDKNARRKIFSLGHLPGPIEDYSFVHGYRGRSLNPPAFIRSILDLAIT